MDFGVLLTALIGFITTSLSAYVSFRLTRRKYNSEVDNNLIINMQNSLEFYKQLSDDNKQRLDTLVERNLSLEKELSELRIQVIRLMGSICTDLSCQLRQKDVEVLNKNIESSKEVTSTINEK